MNNAQIQIAGLEPVLDVRRFRVTEHLMRPFEVNLWAVSLDESLDLTDHIGRRAEFSLVTGPKSHTRRWRGVCAGFGLERAPSLATKELATYRITLVPTWWRLSQRRNNRLFQHCTHIDIVRALLDEWEIAHRFEVDEAGYERLELRTQFAESDLAFMSRMLEEAGITAYLDDEGKDDATLVLADAPASREARDGELTFKDAVFGHDETEGELVTNLRLHEQSAHGRVTLRDHDFRRPRAALYAGSRVDDAFDALHEQYHFAPGEMLYEPLAAHSTTPTADRLGFARRDEARGSFRAQRMLQAARAHRRILSFETNVHDLAPGTVMRVLDHPHAEVSSGSTFLMIGLSLEGKIAENEPWLIEGTAVDTREPYRPPLETPKPLFSGVQVAVVVGAEDGPNQPTIEKPSAGTHGPELGQHAAVALDEAGAAARLIDNDIYVDEYGRVRVQFPWDRQGVYDERSSMWMRVSQGWAGAGYGMFTIPRVGHEVLVSFINGDPDQPVIVGRVHNANQPPPFPLPENKTVSTWKTASSPGGGGFNELRFDDRQGGEHVYLQAQRDMDHLVRHDHKRAVGGHSSRYTQGQDNQAVGGNQTAFVNQNELRATGMNKAELIGLNRSSSIGGEDATQVGSRFSVTVARGLTRRLPRELEEAALSLGGVMRNAAHAVFGMIPQSPLAPIGDATLTRFGESAFHRLRSALSLFEGFQTDPGPPPTSFEMVDRRIKLTTGEASITLDGPNVTITGANITFHALDNMTVLAEDEVAIGGRGKVAVVSADSEIVLQAQTDIHLNPFDPAPSPEPVERVQGLVSDELELHLPICDHCGEPLEEVDGELICVEAAKAAAALPLDLEVAPPPEPGGGEPDDEDEDEDELEDADG